MVPEIGIEPTTFALRVPPFRCNLLILFNLKQIAFTLLCLFVHICVYKNYPEITQLVKTYIQILSKQNAPEIGA